MVKENGNPYTRSFYIEGVGTDNHPITGMLLGLGMETRIRQAYEFLATNYRHGDRIFIFGFSRGAHQARDLAGILSYAGLPATSVPKLSGRMINRIVELTKDESDRDHRCDWTSWSPSSRRPILANEIEENPYLKRLGLRMQAVEIQFLGVWDTVPGSFFKDYGVCTELPDRKRGDRYKTGSYPPIHAIAHAVSSDEKRSRFRPLLVCRAINAEQTKVQEVWFPGAHSDVGGGYEDALRFGAGPPLSTLSFNWMVNLLKEKYTFAIPVERPLPENPAALAHWSIGDSPGNWFSHCEDRKPPSDYHPHPSIEKRHSLASVPLMKGGKEPQLTPYPVACPRDARQPAADQPGTTKDSPQEGDPCNPPQGRTVGSRL